MSCSMCRHRGVTCVFDTAPQKKRGPKGPRKSAPGDAYADADAGTGVFGGAFGVGVGGVVGVGVGVGVGGACNEVGDSVRAR